MVSPFHWVTIPNIALKRAVCVNCSFAIKGAQDMWMHMHRFMHVTWTLLNFGLAQQSWIAHDHSDSDQSNLLSLQSSELLLCFRDMFSKQGFVHECAMLLKTSIESPWMISLPVWLQCWARSSEVRRMYVEADCIDEMPSLEDKVVIGQPTTSFWGVVYMVAW